jgi:hypothetical protein
MTTLKKEIEKTKAEIEKLEENKDTFRYGVIDDIQLFDYNLKGKPTGKQGVQESHSHGETMEVIKYQEELIRKREFLLALQLAEKIEQDNLKKLISEEKVYWECNDCKLLFPEDTKQITCFCGNGMVSNSTKRKMVLSYKIEEVFEK